MGCPVNYEMLDSAYRKWLLELYPPLIEEDQTGEDMAEKLANDFLIGADPEFIVLNNGQPVRLSENQIPHEGEVGWDHSGWVGEFRPAPTRGAYALVLKLRKMIRGSEVLKPLANYKWRGGAVWQGPPALEAAAPVPRPRNNSRRFTLGGHFHFGLPPEGHGGDQAGHRARIQALDRVTRYLESLDVLPKAECVSRRRSGGGEYGRWGDWRLSGDHTEYRTQASWLFSPKTAFTCLTASKLAVAAPALAMDILKENNQSYENFRAFFEAFRFKDVNARRLLEKLVDKQPVENLQADPDEDIKKSWQRLSF